MRESLSLEEAEVAFARGEISRQRLSVIRKKARGECHSCAEKATQGRMCDEHAEAQRARYAAAHPGARKYTCPRCGEPGHNSRTCKGKQKKRSKKGGAV